MMKLTFAVLWLASGVPALAQGHPFVVTSAPSSATPFTVTLPSTLPDGKAAKIVVIEFVTADCQTLPGVNSIGAAAVNVLFQSNFAIYSLAFGPPQSFPNTTEFVSSQSTLIFANPGTTLSYGLSGGQPNCTVVFSGHLQ